MFVRFAVSQIHDNSQRGVGVFQSFRLSGFQALYRLRDEGKLYPHEEEHFRTVSEWFNDNLETPTRFTTAKPPYDRNQSKAISWFKDTAHEHIARIRERWRYWKTTVSQ